VGLLMAGVAPEAAEAEVKAAASPEI